MYRSQQMSSMGLIQESPADGSRPIDRLMALYMQEEWEEKLEAWQSHDPSLDSSEREEWSSKPSWNAFLKDKGQFSRFVQYAEEGAPALMAHLREGWLTSQCSNPKANGGGGGSDESEGDGKEKLKKRL